MCSCGIFPSLLIKYKQPFFSANVCAYEPSRTNHNVVLWNEFALIDLTLSGITTFFTKELLAKAFAPIVLIPLGSNISVSFEQFSKVYDGWIGFETDEISVIANKEVAAKYEIPVELITKLIVSVDENKHITRNNKLQKAFDQIISQNWLHYNSIERAFDNED